MVHSMANTFLDPLLCSHIIDSIRAICWVNSEDNPYIRFRINNIMFGWTHKRIFNAVSNLITETNPHITNVVLDL